MTKDNYHKKNYKNPYTSPKLILHGSIADITRAKRNNPKKDATRQYSQL
jgi:hypothetical protein